MIKLNMCRYGDPTGYVYGLSTLYSILMYERYTSPDSNVLKYLKEHVGIFVLNGSTFLFKILALHNS